MQATREFIENTVDYESISDRFKLLAHPERLRILDLLRRDAECVCHLEAILGKPQPYISQQLKILRSAGLLVDERQGTNVFYRLVNHEIQTILDTVLGPVEPSTRWQSGITCSCPKCAIE
jgi:DNA-binding transcriptional ArsR family regulator